MPRIAQYDSFGLPLLIANIEKTLSKIERQIATELGFNANHGIKITEAKLLAFFSVMNKPKNLPIIVITPYTNKPEVLVMWTMLRMSSLS